MKPTAYMPVYGYELNGALRGYKKNVKWSYWLALWFYWSHNHCAGLRNDDDYLRDICECDHEEWDFVRPVVFDNEKFFTLDQDGLWQQIRAQKEWMKSQSKLESYSNGGKTRWKNVSPEEHSRIAKAAIAKRWNTKQAGI